MKFPATPLSKRYERLQATELFRGAIKGGSDHVPCVLREEGRELSSDLLTLFTYETPKIDF